MILSAVTASLRWSALWTKPHHMIIFDVLSRKSPVGEKGERLRLFLSDVGYAAQASEKRGEIKIRKHAAVIEGHILPDRKKRRH